MNQLLIYITVLFTGSCFSLIQSSRLQTLPYDIVFSWKELDYDFGNSSNRQSFIESGRFIRENNVISGIKVSRDRVFLTVPRWKSGVPATLTYLPYDPVEPFLAPAEGLPLLPYPSWELNELGNCSALQYVQSMEIDQFGRMWIIDVGRVNINEIPDNTCPPKLMIVDTATDTVTYTYVFSSDVVNYTSNFLNDIVVACDTEDDCWAYLSDAADAKIIVFSLAGNSAWYATHSSMFADPDAVNITLEGETSVFRTPVNGIALSPLDNSFDTLYYCPLASFNLYSVSTSTLKRLGDSGASSAVLDDKDVTLHGTKPSQAGGMVNNAEGGLLFGLLSENAAGFWNTTNYNMTEMNVETLIQDDTDLQWPDTFAIDEYGYAYVTTNKLHRFQQNTYDFNVTNFRVARFFIGVKSYLYSSSDSILP